MKKLLYGVFALAMIASLGCAITDYPFVTDTRGGYTGLIRTAHKAYITPSGQVATIYADGSDELFSLVYQNQYGDQKLYTFNNFDPTGAVSFLDQTYCDWQFEDCEIVRAWNPRQNDVDPFDYELFADCSGARSLSLLLSVGTRIGECGDGAFWSDKQALMGVFADLDTTSWRGGTAYVLPINAGNTNITLTSAAGISETVPVFGAITGFVTEKLQLAFPMTPNTRHQINYLRGWVAENGQNATMTFDYAGVSANLDLTFVGDGLTHNAGRF
ncbi:MAG: hypothetical protein HC882_04105 [Acidobacteria bacterium]|nr:hypothetical protein [Acidobacteriota bacterium]